MKSIIISHNKLFAICLHNMLDYLINDNRNIMNNFVLIVIDATSIDSKIILQKLLLKYSDSMYRIVLIHDHLDALTEKIVYNSRVVAVYNPQASSATKFGRLLQHILNGGVMLSKEKLFELRRTESIHTKIVLTKREEDINQLLRKGDSIKVISSELHISQNTVKVYISKIYRKFGVHSRAEYYVNYDVLSGNMEVKI
jgi:DNA-binding NarL/FixJ family response regulator